MFTIRNLNASRFGWSLAVLVLMATTPGNAAAYSAAGVNGAGPGPVTKSAEGQDSLAQPFSSSSLTQLLSPTAQNVFNFGPHKFKVQYPAGQNFSGIYMTVNATQLTQSMFAQRVAGTSFALSQCVVYTGENGNCIDYQVTCSNSSHVSLPCPGTPAPTISVLSSYDTSLPIVNPGCLTTPNGLNLWRNILKSFFMMRIDPTSTCPTNGFSEFVAVGLGPTNPQGLGEFAFNMPLRPQDPRSFTVGSAIPVSFALTSAAHPGVPVTDAVASLSVLMVADSHGNPTSVITFTQQSAFVYSGGSYSFTLPSLGFAPGTYILTVYGNAFASQAVTFTIH
jgi:hypothetical protein